MLFFEIEMDEDQLRSMIKNIIDQYEKGLHNHGSYQAAVEYTQEITMKVMEDMAESVEELIEHTGTMH